MLISDISQVSDVKWVNIEQQTADYQVQTHVYFESTLFAVKIYKFQIQISRKCNEIEILIII